jgi:hypothetical protein
MPSHEAKGSKRGCELTNDRAAILLPKSKGPAVPASVCSLSGWEKLPPKMDPMIEWSRAARLSVWGPLALQLRGDAGSIDLLCCLRSMLITSEG